jgi:hypothetical protein
LLNYFELTLLSLRHLRILFAAGGITSGYGPTQLCGASFPKTHLNNVAMTLENFQLLLGPFLGRKSLPKLFLSI